MISFVEYRTLPQNRQAEILWTDGVYLELIRHMQGLNIELYALGNFYVEVYFDQATEEPLFLKAFKNAKGLNHYLSLICIEDAFEFGNNGFWK